MATPEREFSYGVVEIYNEETLGVGSYGKVCKAKCGQLPAAVKLLHDTMFGSNDPGILSFTEKFEKECDFLKMIKHPNIVQFLGLSKDPQSGRLGLLMELMDESLTRFLERSTGPLPYHIQVNIGQDVALALAYLHTNDIIHRDLSSNNVLLIGEGTRAKVTDFGMSTLIGTNPRLTQLTQCPGTTAYMPPEAFITPPQYSSKLDCFSHGVLAIQIATRQFPDPGDAYRCIDNPAYPTGQILVPFPETERRKEHIDQVEPDHPLLPLALHCLKDRDTERPSADELCGRLASLKREPKYRCSVEQSRQQQDTLLQQQDVKLAKSQADWVVELSSKLQQCRKEYEAKLTDKDSATENVISELHKKVEHLNFVIEKLRIENLKLEEQPKTVPVPPPRHKRRGTFSSNQEETDPPVTLTWIPGELAPNTLSSYWGAAVVHNDTAYFSRNYNVYSYTIPEDKWSPLKPCRYEYFSMAVVDDRLTTIGGEHADNATNTLLCLSGSSSEMKWEGLFPPMPTERVRPAAVTTATHLVVAGGTLFGTGAWLETVGVLNLRTFHWASASSTPVALIRPNIALSGDRLYLSGHNPVFSCSVKELIKSRKPVSANGHAGGSVWTRLPNTPTYNASLATLRGHVLAIGGSDGYSIPAGAIHCYDRHTDLWTNIGDMPTARFDTLVAVLPSNSLVVVGGQGKRRGEKSNVTTRVTEIASPNSFGHE